VVDGARSLRFCPPHWPWCSFVNRFDQILDLITGNTVHSIDNCFRAFREIITSVFQMKCVNLNEIYVSPWVCVMNHVLCTTSHGIRFEFYVKYKLHGAYWIGRNQRMKFEILVTVNIKITVFWDAMSGRLI
jgi:hypothetical protein